MSASARTTRCSRKSTARSSSVPKPKAAYSYRYFRCRRQRPSNTVDQMRSAGIQSPGGPEWAPKRGDRDAGSPFRFSAGAHAMTLAEKVAARPEREHGIAVLKTGRLVLRAPCADDAKAIVRLAGDLRVAANTARI